MTVQLADAGVQIGGQWLVRGVSLSVEPGQVTALVGPNGSGKSTLLRLLAGIWRPSEGTALLNGEAIAGMNRRAAARSITLVPQNPHIDIPFTVREVVSMGRYPHLGRFDAPGSHDFDATQAALVRADVAHLANRRVNELSGGEFQRVVIARSLATESDVILLDEPTAGLDLNHSLETLEMLHQLAEAGAAIAIALHDLNAASRWADVTALLQDGQLVACGRTSEVLTDERVSPVFGVEIERLRAATGTPVLVFRNRSQTDR